jgi:hypothetical protein
MFTQKLKQFVFATVLFLNFTNVFGQSQDTTVYPVDALEVKPQFNNKGDTSIFNFLAKNMRIPVSARSRVGLIGRSYISFIIDEKGQLEESSVKLVFFQTGINDKDKKVIMIKDASKLDDIQTDCVNEAKRVVGLLKNWTPGTVGGKGVRCTKVMPITIKNEGTFSR